MTDLPGKAIHDYYFNKSKIKLYVKDIFGPKVEMPLSLYFRGLSEMPDLEKKALQLSRGKILDIGAGSGSHVLELQKNNDEVYALEISPSACEVMKNGIGLSSTLEGFKKFLKKAEDILHLNGRLIFDSCDISYMYEVAEKPDYYYGQVKCRYEYDQLLTDWFEWLYLDKNTMTQIATECGWNAEVVFEDENDQYLAVLTKRN